MSELNYFTLVNRKFSYFAVVSLSFRQIFIRAEWIWNYDFHRTDKKVSAGQVVHFADLVWLREAYLAAQRGPVVHCATKKRGCSFNSK